MVLTRLATLAIWGAALSAPQAQASPRQTPPKGLVPALSASQSPGLSEVERIAKLRTLVEAAEKALDSEDEDAAFDRADEAEVLVADWDQTMLQRPDVQILLERLKGVQTQVPQNGPPGTDDKGKKRAQELEPGMKEPGEVTILKGSDLSSELARVQAAEQGATYDFPIDLNDKVLTWVRLFTTERRGYMERSLGRGAAYFPMIRQVFAEEGVPQDLAYLGIVESGYINHAKSYARAVGMWQFMPSTGRLFGLKINRWMDERRDPVKSTHAAARYLKRLYDLSGDWYLALVGYNAGPLTTQKAQANLGTSNFWDMFRSPYLRNQTKNYVPELCAAILIAHNPEQYGFQLEPDAPFVFEPVEVRSATSLRSIAKAAGVSETAIKELNPQLLRGTTPPGTYEARVPVGSGLEAQRRLGGSPKGRREKLPTYTPLKATQTEARASSAPIPPVPSVQESQTAVPTPTILVPEKAAIYRAQPGDTLAKISRDQGVSFSELIRLNPEAVKHLGVGDPVTLPPTVSGGVGNQAGNPTRPKFHRVRQGETLTAISDRYGVGIAELKAWNQLRTGRIVVGQKLRLVPR